jgi:hypothetical protein
MRLFSKRNVASLFISLLNLSTFIRKLYPIAVQQTYSNISREKIDDLRGLLDLEKVVGLIRVGDEFDGGYAISSEISPNANCISIGVGTNISFDIEIAERLKSVHLYDHTVAGLPRPAPENVSFFDKGLGLVSNSTFVTLQEAILKFPSESPLILKMDIEGAEWSILENIDMQTLSRFEQIVIEFHDLHQINNLKFFDTVIRCLTNLNSYHAIVNRHPNNWGKFDIIHGVAVPDVLEVTYLKRDNSQLESLNSVTHANKQTNFPCNPNGAEISLTF